MFLPRTNSDECKWTRNTLKLMMKIDFQLAAWNSIQKQRYALLSQMQVFIVNFNRNINWRKGKETTKEIK